MSEGGALDGARVLSFGAFVAGNTTALLLAELGADVVKIEARGRPEVLRSPAYAIGPSYTEPSGVPNTVMYGALSRSVRSLSIDLETAEGQAVFRRLATRTDVVVENFAGPTLARWGCAFEDLAAANDRLVMVSLSGYGRTGPRAGYLAYATNICGYVGLTSAWGYTHGTHSDYVTAATAALATVAAMRVAAAGDGPIHIDVSQIEAMANVMPSVLLDPLVHGREPVTAPNDQPGSWLCGVWPCQGEDQWLAVDIEDGRDWSALCRFLDRADLDAGDEGAAVPLRSELSSALGAWAADRTHHSAAHLLQKEGLAAGPVQDSEDVWRDPQLRSRGFMVPIDQPEFGVLHYPHSAYRLSRTPGRIQRPGPRLGQHTREVLAEWLDLSDREWAELEAAGGAFAAGPI